VQASVQEGGMTWVADPKKHEAINEHGYRISWAQNKFGTWFNAWDRNGKHLEASYDREKCKVACEKHHETSQIP
jgi:hypothetical protein